MNSFRHSVCVALLATTIVSGVRWWAHHGVPTMTDEMLARNAQVFAAATVIDLSRSDVTDEGLKHLAGCKNLTKIRLDGCDGITNASLRALVKLPALQFVHLKDTHVTEEAVGMARIARPDICWCGIPMRNSN